MACVNEGMDISEVTDDDGIIAMDLDLSEEQILLAELHSYRNHFPAVMPALHDKSFYGVPIDTQQVDYTDFLYIVLDTNVLLSHLKFLKELKDHTIKGVGRPVLIIPWIVIQELDALKDSIGSLGVQAVSAGSFINDSLSSHHPRIRGQTIEEVNTELNNIAITNNDDRILHCCMVYQYKILQSQRQGVVVLFSNDNMLCVKAKINNVISCNRKTLMKSLKDIVSNRDVSSYTHTEEYLVKVNKELVKDNNSRLYDDCLCEAESRARDALSVIIDNEMREAYGDLCNDVMARKPPWSLEDVLFLFNKHWIAVFSFTFGSSKMKIKKLLESLQEHMDNRQSVYLTSSVVSSFIDSVLGILDHFHHKKNSSIWSMISVSFASLKVLKDKVKDNKLLQSSSPAAPVSQSLVSPPPPLQSLPHLSSLPLTASVCSPVLTQQTQNPLDQFLFIFQSIRESIINTIASIEASLINNLFNEEAELRLIRILKCLEELIISIESLLNQGMVLHLVKNIHQSIINYLNIVLSLNATPITEDQLIELCQLQVTAVVSIFRESLGYMAGGRYQLVQLLHRAAANNNN